MLQEEVNLDSGHVVEDADTHKEASAQANKAK
jgi:hypothetical protein